MYATQWMYLPRCLVALAMMATLNQCRNSQGLESDVVQPRVHLVKGMTPLMVAVTPINNNVNYATLATV